MKQTLARLSAFVASASLLAVLGVASMPTTASADSHDPLVHCSAMNNMRIPKSECDKQRAILTDHLGTSGEGDPALECTPGGDNPEGCNLYRKYINPIIWFLSAAVGLAVTIGIIMGGIRYATSGGDSSQTANAKNQIRNAVVALIVFLFLLTAFNWLIPGGLR